MQKNQHQDDLSLFGEWTLSWWHYMGNPWILPALGELWPHSTGEWTTLDFSIGVPCWWPEWGHPLGCFCQLTHFYDQVWFFVVSCRSPVILPLTGDTTLHPMMAGTRFYWYSALLYHPLLHGAFPTLFVMHFFSSGLFIFEILCWVFYIVLYTLPHTNANMWYIS